MTPKNDNYEHNLYYTQHKWLPHFFYGATAPLMKEIQEQKGQLFIDLFHAMHKDETDYRCPIRATDFKISSYINETQTIMQIIMPQLLYEIACDVLESRGHCHDIYISTPLEKQLILEAYQPYMRQLPEYSHMLEMHFTDPTKR